jgi:hypothetical protein
MDLKVRHLTFDTQFGIRMKNGLLYSIFIFISTNISSQNLVINGDFENYGYCNLNDSSFVFSMEPAPFYANNWYFPIPVHADYLNVFCVSKMRKFLVKVLKSAPAKEGQGFAGFNLLGPDGYFEPITGTLNEPLIKDSTYKVSLNLCYMKDFSEFYSKKIGIKFTDKLQVYPLPLHKWDANYNKMFKKYEKVSADNEIDISELADTNYWQMFSFLYNAKGGERYITIGIFYQQHFDFINYSKQFASVCWNKKAKPWLRLHKKTPLLVFRGDISTFLDLDESQKRMCYYLLDDVVVEMIIDE